MRGKGGRFAVVILEDTVRERKSYYIGVQYLLLMTANGAL